MDFKVTFNEINVKEEKEQTLFKVLMLKGDKGDPGANDYNELINKPTKLSDFTNDGVFITNDAADLVNYYKKSETYTQSETDNLIGNKVDKVTGKGLSTEDYTTSEKTKLSNIEAQANKTTVVQSTGSSTTSVMSQNAVTTQLNGKVDKVTGKGLSTEDYTTSEKTKLSNIEAQANKTTVVQSTGSSTTSVMSQNAVTTQLNGKVDKVTGKGLSTEDYTTSEKTKLSNIEAQANKTTVVQSTGSSTTSVMSQNAVTSALPVIEAGTMNLTLTCREPEGGATPVNPTYTTYYNNGKYKRIDNICFITFHLKVNITNAGVGYVTISGLPYTSDNVIGQALSMQEVYGAIKGADGNSNTTGMFAATIQDGSTTIILEHNNGATATTFGTGDLWVGFTGFYFISV